MKIKQILRIVFDETTTQGDTAEPWKTRRYIAKALAPTGGGWGVYDQKRGRFLSDTEVKRIDPREPI